LSDHLPPESLTAAARLAGRHRHVLELGGDDLEPAATALLGDGFRLALVAAHDDDDGDGDLRVVYLFTAGNPDRRVELLLRTAADKPSVPSLAAHSFPASRFEREMHDLFGIRPAGHPQPARLVLHQHWPEGWHPMRRDAGPPPPFADESQPYPFLAVEGPGVYEIPVGPVHAGLIEPGHFRFSVVGETILNMKARLWFVHKGVERLFEGRDASAGVELAERISGDTAVGHNLAYCLAVEDACECDVPDHVQALRAVLLELERLYNHVADIGALCNDVGFGIAHAHALRVRERLLRLNAQVTGHRLLRGGIYPGGATARVLPHPAELDAIVSDVHDIVAIALANSTVVDRFTGTSILTGQQAADIGTLGYVARASGLDQDARRHHSPAVGLYDSLRVPVYDTGDVMARFRVRVEEIDASVGLLRQLLESVTPGICSAAPLYVTGRRRAGVGISEGWRGTIVHRVELDARGRLTRVKIVDPSFLNWPALPVALTGTIVPDFPLTNKSFNLSYAGNDL
jgi:Ni,Fe-hydrogenase III large subunit/Ni,Fe-hydrogenase III component G